ncbi:MAG: class I SAM-dependent methyltransferase [Candidatus Pacebacteria bacterium]|nr:class I SAM-dependent methyltransferase [Candidatus Paceibacterota bacterium]
MDQRTIDTYNQKAKEYDYETLGFWEEFPRSFIDRFVSLTKGKVLNIGSGPGRDGLLLKERGLDVTCLDASEAMVKICKDKGFNAVLGDFLEVPFKDDSFTAIWAYTSLLHVSKKDVDKALGEVVRVLEKDGIFGFGMIEGDSEEYKESPGIDLPRLFSKYKREELEDLLKEHHFKILYLEEFKPRKNNYLNFICQKI